jgi:hypothetical protein
VPVQELDQVPSEVSEVTTRSSDVACAARHPAGNLIRIQELR